MKIATTISMMKQFRREMAGTVGFVPTMGYLHEGHLTLVRQAKRENDAVVVSIFVNPTQFGPSEDFEKYPRDAKRDISLLQAEGVSILFMPEAPDMYPAGFNSWVDLEGITDKLEGAVRPGHFRGVTTVVNKLFNITEATRAYFGQKDAQQALVIQKMALELNMNIEVIVSPTVREADGLARSSRNVYLDSEERQAALVLWRSLTSAQKLWQTGERDAGRIKAQMIELISAEPGAVIDYVSITDTRTLEELAEMDGPSLVSIAVRIGKTRLIDNIILQ